MTHHSLITRFLSLMMLLFLIAFSPHSYAQALMINWQQCYGGSEGETGISMIPASNGYMLFCGTSSGDGQVPGNHGLTDFWLVRTDIAGNILWSKVYGGSGDEYPMQMAKYFDDGYILCGSTFSNNYKSNPNGDVIGNHGSPDYWVLRVDTAGNIVWAKCFGGTDYELAAGVTITSDSGIVISGKSASTDGNVTGNHGGYDMWIMKLFPDGNINWEKSFGGSLSDGADHIAATPDGGMIVAGYTSSPDGDVQCNYHGGNYDAWILKLDLEGNIEWQRCYGGTDSDNAVMILPAADNGYLFCASTSSDDGDVSGNHGGIDYWVVKIDHQGEIQWQKCYGGSKNDNATCIKAGSDNSFYIGGYTSSDDGDVSGNHSWSGLRDMWLIKISGEGALMWQQCFGGSMDEILNDIAVMPDNQLMLFGYSETPDNTGDVHCEHHGPGNTDAWLLSLTDTTSVGIPPVNNLHNTVSSCPNPATNQITFKFDIAPDGKDLRLIIYNEFGKVQHIFPLPAARGEFQWNTENISPGVYYYNFCNDRFSKTGKIVILKE